MKKLKFSNYSTNIIAVALLASTFFIAIFSVRNDSATFDEPAFISGGYSHMTQRDYRLDLDHPPLITDMIAFPLLFLDLNFPKNSPFWDMKGDNKILFGSEFLYRSGNNPDQILFFSRLPMIFLLIFLGWFLFKWTKELAGNKVALLVLALFSLSPNFLAHGKLATTDVAAALGVVLSTYFWLKFLKKPSKKNIIFAGLIFGLAMLLKFSLVLLVPFFGIITVIYGWLKTNNLRQVIKYIGLAVLIGIIGMVFVVWPFYQLHILDYPIERQLEDSNFYLLLNGLNPLEKISLWMVTKPILRPFAQYVLGFLINLHVAGGGTDTTTYFLGDIYRSVGWRYFPIVYLLKVPLAFHILTLIALFVVMSFIKKLKMSGQRLKKLVSNHFTEFSMIIFLIIYWLIAINSKLNIGVRHLLPAFPFTYILVSLGVKKWIKDLKLSLKKIAAYSILILLIWYGASSLMIYPYYLSYFNEIVGGSQNGYKYFVDSNYDWGQDLKRLAKWVDFQEIDKIYIDYFGGGNVQHYLGKKYMPWRGSSWWSYSGVMQDPQDFPRGNYLAVSATFLQGAWKKSNFNQLVRDYSWLDDYEPVARVGHSMFIYYVK